MPNGKGSRHNLGLRNTVTHASLFLANAREWTKGMWPLETNLNNRNASGDLVIPSEVGIRLNMRAKFCSSIPNPSTLSA